MSAHVAPYLSAVSTVRIRGFSLLEAIPAQAGWIHQKVQEVEPALAGLRIGIKAGVVGKRQRPQHMASHGRPKDDPRCKVGRRVVWPSRLVRLPTSLAGGARR